MRLSFLATAAAVVLIAAAPAPPASLESIVKAALAAAPSHFSDYVGKAGAKYDYEQKYHPSGALAKLCPSCEVRDEYADTDSDERWVVQFDYPIAKGWSSTKAASYVLTTLGPLVPAFTLKTGTEYDETYFDWTHGKTFLYVTIEKSAIQVRVGRYTATNVHRAKFSTPLTDAQKTALKGDIKNFLSVGLAAAPSNFSTLRGKVYGADVYAASLSFDDLFGECDINGYTHTSTISNRWILSCETPFLSDPKATLEPVIADAVWYALPSSFSKGDAGINDYRYDQTSPDSISVMINSYAEGGKTKYTIMIFHFI